ncbi:MAG: hypothetical protein KatS3mg020_0087 [Fimbriimonadales bacterium]|nr:MAG: hypothetical protein KatS3mg020_0087 [Fimbriimonadales bacterium]
MQPTLPKGWTQETYQWLRALGLASDPAPLLRQHREWQRAEWVQQRLDALQGLAPRELRQLLPCVRGLIRIADRVGDRDLRCYARQRLLEFHQALYDLNGVLPVMRQLELIIPQATLRRQVQGRRVVAALYDMQGDSERAVAQAQHALRAAQTLGDLRLLSQCEYQLAILYYRQGDLERSVQVIQRSRTNAQQANATIGVAEAWLFEGVLRRARGEYDLALRAYQNARPLYEQANFPLGVARCIANTGLVYWTMGLYEDARTHYREAMPLFQQLGSEWDVATCMLNTAILLQQDGDFDEAMTLYQEVSKRYEALGDKEGVAYCLQSMASTQLRQQRFDEATQLAHRAILAYSQAGNLPMASHARLVKAETLLHQNRSQEALQTLQRVQSNLKTLNSPILQIDYHYLRGDTYARLGRHTDASRAFKQCLTQLQQTPALTGIPPEEVSIYLNRFREQAASIVGYYGRRGQWREAWYACQMSKGNALRLAWQAPRRYPELRPTERQRLDALRRRYEEAAAQESRARTSTQQRRLRRETERALTEWRAYQRQLGARYPRLRWQQPEPLAPDQLPIDSQTLIVEYALAEDTLTLIWTRRESGRIRIGGAVQHVPIETIRNAIQQLLSLMEHEAPKQTISRESRKLYDWLIRPIEAQLGGIQRLMVCPHGDLHATPWGALQNGQGRFLVERVAIGSCPSASAWTVAQQMAKRKPTPSLVLAVAVSEFGGQSEDTRARLSPLPGVIREAQAVAQVWGRIARVFRDDQASRSVILQQMTRAGILHFATHAVPNLRMPMLSALALSGKKTVEWLYAHDALQTHLKARLAVLSACRTGIGASTSEGALGLHWAFLAAGCPTVLATLWRLPDEAAPAWTHAFYKHYHAGKSPGDASRLASLQLRKNPRFLHPRYWGAWQVYGAL